MCPILTSSLTRKRCPGNHIQGNMKSTPEDTDFSFDSQQQFGLSGSPVQLDYTQNWDCVAAQVKEFRQHTHQAKYALKDVDRSTHKSVECVCVPCVCRMHLWSYLSGSFVCVTLVVKASLGYSTYMNIHIRQIFTCYCVRSHIGRKPERKMT